MLSYNKLFFYMLILTQNVWAAGGSESMDRPSANIPGRPSYLSDKPEFHLPALSDAITPLVPNSGQIYIARYKFSGNTIFNESELQQLTTPYLARLVRIDELEELRQRLTHFYIEHGYVNSGARIPKNALHDGILNFEIVEGKLDDIQIHGQEGLNENYIKSRLSSDKPLNINELQEQFQLLLIDPLISSMRGSLLPSSNPAGSILDVEVSRARPYQVTLFANNYRPPSIGAEAGGISSWIRNLTGLGDMVDFTFQGSEGALLYSGGWSIPVFNYGTQVYFHFTEGDSSVVESSGKQLDIKSKVHNLEGGLSHPFLNNLKRKLTLGTSFAVRENETSLLGRSFSFIPGETTGQTQVSVIRFYQEHIERMDEQVLALRSTFSVGLNTLGATFQSNPTNPSSEFFTWLGQGQYAHRVFENGSQVVLRGNVQLANSPLLPLERMAVGGVNTVRGYRENQLVRDEGFTNSLEFHYPLFGGEPNAQHSLSFVPFMDYGGAWNIGQSATYLHSTGLGLNWKFYQLNAEFYWAHKINAPEPVTHANNLQDEGIHFQVKLDAF